MGAAPLAEARPQLVLLAAGRSSRMGQPKGLVLYRGRPWIEHQLAQASSAGVDRVVLVLGHDHERYLAALARLPAPPQPKRPARPPRMPMHMRIEAAVNEAPERGPFSSLQCGIQRVDPAAPVFVLPVDVPAAAPGVWQALSSALSPSVDAAVPSLQGEGGGGHPVLLSSTFAARLLREPADARLDVLLKSRDTAVIRVCVDDPRVRMNLNEPGDWGRLDEG